MIDFLAGDAKNWLHLEVLPPKSYKCGFCSDKISSERGYKIGLQRDGSGTQIGGIYICPSCHGPTFFAPNGKQIPDGSIGNSVLHVPDNLNALYEEARKCVIDNCYTAAVLLCRKLLMHISVEQGAQKGLSFVEYVEYLSDKNYIPPNGKSWVNHIRKKGNEANHEIVLMDQNDAKDLIVFIEMLLKFIYEFPKMVPQEDKT